MALITDVCYAACHLCLMLLLLSVTYKHIMLYVVILSVIVLSVMAPCKLLYRAILLNVILLNVKEPS
jgi:hypothetical protein